MAAPAALIPMKAEAALEVRPETLALKEETEAREALAVLQAAALAASEEIFFLPWVQADLDLHSALTAHLFCAPALAATPPTSLQSKAALPATSIFIQ